MSARFTRAEVGTAIGAVSTVAAADELGRLFVHGALDHIGLDVASEWGAHMRNPDWRELVRSELEAARQRDVALHGLDPGAPTDEDVYRAIVAKSLAGATFYGMALMRRLYLERGR